tara:strand:- start:2513 stop:2668 length:156 start_codon:yes stop_codon:yes gene_type:complete
MDSPLEIYPKNIFFLFLFSNTQSCRLKKWIRIWMHGVVGVRRVEQTHRYWE